MTPTPQTRQRIEHCLAQLSAWRQSGMALKPYTELHGHSYPQWRAWLGFEAHWRQTLAGAPSTRFVHARPAQDMPGTPAPSAARGPAPALRIALQNRQRRHPRPHRLAPRAPRRTQPISRLAA